MRFIALNKKINFLIKLLTLTSVFTSTAVFANSSSEEVGRYLSVSEKPKECQIHLLTQVIQVRFPQNIQTVGDAMGYVLRLSGYGLVDANQMSVALKSTLQKPLPAIDRDFGPMPLEDALITLAGPAFSLEQNALTRSVNFKVKPQFAKSMSESNKI